jgi:hypothetical protein
MTIATTSSGIPVGSDTHLWLVRRAARIIQEVIADGHNTGDQMVWHLTNADPDQLVQADFVVPLDEGERAVLVLDLSLRPVQIGDTEQRLAHQIGLACGLFDCTDCRQEVAQR